MKPERIFLLGFMGAGKSTVARRLSEQLDWPFVDTDQEIEREQGMDVSEIFNRRGEDDFRRLETEVLERLSRTQPPLIVACGGGLPLRSENRRLMDETGIPIYLDVTPETARRRIGEAEDRPLWQDHEQIRSLWEQRQPSYQAIPHSVNVNGRTPEEVVECVYRTIREIQEKDSADP